MKGGMIKLRDVATLTDKERAHLAPVSRRLRPNMEQRAAITKLMWQLKRRVA